MDTTKTNGTAQRKNRAGTRKNLLKFMFFLFILHAIVTFLSHGTGVVETFRSFLIHVFWQERRYLFINSWYTLL